MYESLLVKNVMSTYARLSTVTSLEAFQVRTLLETKI